MHPKSEYSSLLKDVIAMAKRMIACLPSSQADKGKECLSFLEAFGYEGYPGSGGGNFHIGSFVVGTRKPGAQKEGIAIILCFSDNVSLVPPEGNKSVTPGQLLRGSQALVLHDVDHWSLSELALTLLHEARHARHRLGPKMAKLEPLDSNDDLHETNTWLFIANILVMWGKEIWEKAVSQEITWLESRNLEQPRPGHIACDESAQDWPELERLFGASEFAEVRRFRRALVSLQANMRYWSERDKTLNPESICHSLVKCYYDY